MLIKLTSFPRTFVWYKFQKVYMKTPELVILTCLKCLLRGWKVLGWGGSRMRSVLPRQPRQPSGGGVRLPIMKLFAHNLGGQKRRSLAPIKGVTLLQMMCLFWYWSCYMTWRKSTKDSLCMYTYIYIKAVPEVYRFVAKTLWIVCTWCFSNKASSTYIYIYIYPTCWIYKGTAKQCFSFMVLQATLSTIPTPESRMKE